MDVDNIAQFVDNIYRLPNERFSFFDPFQTLKWALGEDPIDFSRMRQLPETFELIKISDSSTSGNYSDNNATKQFNLGNHIGCDKTVGYDKLVESGEEALKIAIEWLKNYNLEKGQLYLYKAKNHFECAVKLRKRNNCQGGVRALYCLAKTYFYAGNPEKATELTEEIMCLCYEYIFSHYLRAYILYNQMTFHSNEFSHTNYLALVTSLETMLAFEKEKLSSSFSKSLLQQIRETLNQLYNQNGNGNIKLNYQVHRKFAFRILWSEDFKQINIPHLFMAKDMLERANQLRESGGKTIGPRECYGLLQSYYWLAQYSGKRSMYKTKIKNLVNRITTISANLYPRNDSERQNDYKPHAIMHLGVGFVYHNLFKRYSDAIKEYQYALEFENYLERFGSNVRARLERAKMGIKDDRILPRVSFRD